MKVGDLLAYRGPGTRSGAASVALALIAGVFVLTPEASAYPRPGRTERVSVSGENAQANSFSERPSVSADGRYVAFTSAATNLVADDTNNRDDVFVKDRETGAVERVSVASDGSQATNFSNQPAISATGRFVVFTSFATNLAPGSVTNANIYIRDRATDTTELVSVRVPGEPSISAGSSHPSVSADGRFVAFSSSRTDLVPDTPQAPGAQHVYVRDRQASRTDLVSVATDGTIGNSPSFTPTISDDGRHVAFISMATNLVEDDTNGALDTFVHDRVEKTTERVSISSDGDQGNSNSGEFSGEPPSLSADGRYVAFASSATNLVPHDGNDAPDIFVHDRETSTTERISVASTWGEGNGASDAPTISADGRYVSFHSDATDLVPEPASPRRHAYVHDRVSNATERVSVTTGGVPGNGPSSHAAVSGNGRYVAFASMAGDLVPNDTNSSSDIFVRDTGPMLGIGELDVAVAGDDVVVSGWATFSGRRVAEADDPPDDAAPGARHAGAELTGASVILRPEQEDVLMIFDLAALPGQPAGLGAGAPGVVYALEFEAEGARYQVRATRAGISGGAPSVPSFALYHCEETCTEQAGLTGGMGTTGARVAVSVPLDELQWCCPGAVFEIRAFTAVADAATSQLTTLDEVVLPDAKFASPHVELALAPAGTPAEEVIFDAPAVVAEGSFSATLPGPEEVEAHEAVGQACLGAACGAVVRTSIPTPDLEPSPPPEPSPDPTPTAVPTPTPTVSPTPIVGERRTERISMSHTGAQTDDHSNRADISQDGRFVAFWSRATNLVSNDINGSADIFVTDLATGETELVSVSSDGEQANGFWTRDPSISADGRYVAYESSSSNLVPGDTNFRIDVFVHDRATGKTERVSVSSDGSEANEESTGASISADGRYVAFESFASNLVQDDTNDTSDVFVHDRHTKTTTRVSVSSDGEQGNDWSWRPAISADGRAVAFYSIATNLVNDGSMAGGAYVHDLDTGVTERVSVSTDGRPANSDPSTRPAISADGRHVAFDTPASNLVPFDNNINADVFVRDREAGTTERVSLTSAGQEAGLESSFRPRLSADGRFVVFDSGAEIVPHQRERVWPCCLDIYIHDRVTGVTERVSVDEDGVQTDDHSFWPSVTGDGRFVALESRGTTLVEDDTNGVADIFRRDVGPAIGVGLLTASPEAGGAAASGWVKFWGKVLAQASSSDSFAGGDPAGLDIRGGRAIYRPELGDLLVRLELHSMPNLLGIAGTPGVVYGASVTIDGIRYEARAAKSPEDALTAQPRFALYRCDGDCERVVDIDGSYGRTDTEVRFSLPLDDLGASEGAELTDMRVFSGLGTAETGVIASGDDLGLGDSDIPARVVHIGAVAPGDPDPGSFEAQATLDGDAFDAFVDDRGMSSYDVVAQGCLGIECGPVVRTEAARGSLATLLSFTAASATATQYSDETLFEARLTNSAADPIEGETLTFTLSGEESARDFTSTTNEDGVASVVPTITEKPGPYQLTVRFAGDDDHAASADTIPFVVEKKDTATELTVQGQGRNMTLRARLSHLDSPSERVAGRTIDFYSDGELIGSDQTNSNGVAETPVPPGHRGANRTYEAVFSGDDFYEGSSDRRSGRGGGRTGGADAATHPNRPPREAT